MGANSQVSLAQSLDRRHLLGTIQVEVLELHPVFRMDESLGLNGEAALVERHERDDITLRWVRHYFVPGHSPLLGVGKRGQLPGGDTAKDRAGHAGMRPVRHGDGGLSHTA